MKKIDAPEKVIFICDGKKCSRYNDEVYKGFRHLIKEYEMKRDVELTCMNVPIIAKPPRTSAYSRTTYG